MNAKAANRLRIAAITLVAFAILALALASLNFRLARSDTTTKVQASTGSSQTQLVSQLRNQKVLLYVEEQGRFSESLRRQLQAGLEQRGLFGDIQVIDKYDDQMPDSSIVMIAKNADDTYTPFYATASLQVQFFYSSNGDLSFIRTGQSVFGNQEGEAPKAVLQSKQVVDLTDTTVGITSYPAYYDYLASKTVEAVLDQLEKTLSVTQ